jgi:glycine hydroxymethyltransferase
MHVLLILNAWENSLKNVEHYYSPTSHILLGLLPPECILRQFLIAEFVTTTTHKTLRGPRGGLILCKKEFAKAIDSILFPGTQGGPLMHVIAGKAVCFKEAMSDGFKRYQKQVIENAKTLASVFAQKGYFVVSGGTDNHLLLLDLRKTHPNLDGKTAQNSLEENRITLNRNTVPGETRSPFLASGLRIGTPAVTTRGMKEAEMMVIAELIDQTLNDLDKKHSADIRQKVSQLCQKFPLPY